MTRVLLVAGVAALAIAAPASAGPHGQHGGGGAQPAFQSRGGGGGHGGGYAAPRVQRQAPQRMQRQAMPRMERQQRFAIERPQRSQRFAMREQARPMHANRAEARMASREQMRASHSRAQQRVSARQQVRANRSHAQQRVAAREQMRASRSHAQQRVAARQQAHANRAQAMNRQQMRAGRVQQAQNRASMRQQLQANSANRAGNRMAMRQQLQANRLNQTQNNLAMRQQGAQNLLAQRRALQPDRIANVGAFRSSRFASIVDTPRTRFIPPADAVRFVGQPVNRVTNYVTLAALPASVSYLYPATANYYYQYGGGYLYQIDRSDSLIAALIPLLAGGYLPGTYLPDAYMSSYVPSYYGLSSFYPASYDYGYGAYYGYATPNLCNRYAYGVVYQVDCFNGMVENVIPTYAYGYGVGQMLPAAYSYYNLPMQYRSYYYPTADYSYWYAPGAIYQYDAGSSLITSVAALMSPGFTIGQPLPVGYTMYNVPMAYRATYYDTPNAWYRYNDGYIYQVDPATMLVTSVVASLLS